MKVAIVLLMTALPILPCKKQTENVPLRCGTVFNQPNWAKNFSKDSLFNISGLIFNSYHSHSPSNQRVDTSYSLSVPIQFLSNSTGVLNNNATFTYKILLTNSYPEVHVTALNDLSSILPFANTFLSQNVIKLRVDWFSKLNGQFVFTNGVEYPLTTQTYENCYLSFKRN